MATYKEMQGCVRGKYGYTVKSCWIAHMKEVEGVHPRVAPNRQIAGVRQVPCPPGKEGAIRDAFRHFGMIPG